MDTALLALATACTALTGVVGFALWDIKKKAGQLRRLQPILKVEHEVERLRQIANGVHKEIEKLRGDYAAKRGHFDALSKEVALYDDRLAFAEIGVYEPHFEFGTGEAYKLQILHIRNDQKRMIEQKTAAVCPNDWQVDGSRAKGKTMTNRHIRLALRAFNNECEAIIANVRWNNAAASEMRIVRAQEQINRMNESNGVVINSDYVSLRIKELRLVHERQEKLKHERDERREASQFAREEERLLRDLARAQDEEGRFQRMVEKARAEAAGLVGPQLALQSKRIAFLEAQLAAAHTVAERAQAMAERTKTGWVYIISNIGSFGKDIVKIGLTRRLEPEDRIRELGDASVPFLFYSHAMIYSEDAPALERALHREFEPVRVNAQNFRKEFFRASLDEVEAAVKRLAPQASFFKEIESQEYRERLMRRQQSLLEQELAAEIALPIAI